MIELNVCIGSACHLKGSYNIIQAFQQLIEKEKLHDEIELKASFCMKQCQNAGVGVRLGEESYVVSQDGVKQFFLDTVVPAVK